MLKMLAVGKCPTCVESKVCEWMDDQSGTERLPFLYPLRRLHPADFDVGCMKKSVKRAKMQNVHEKGE